MKLTTKEKSQIITAGLRLYLAEASKYEVSSKNLQEVLDMIEEWENK